MTEHEHQLFKHLEHLMSTIDQQLAGQLAVLNQILEAVQAIPKAEDLTPVTSGITALEASITSMQGTVAAIAAKLPVDASS